MYFQLVLQRDPSGFCLLHERGYYGNYIPRDSDEPIADLIYLDVPVTRLVQWHLAESSSPAPHDFSKLRLDKRMSWTAIGRHIGRCVSLVHHGKGAAVERKCVARNM